MRSERKGSLVAPARSISRSHIAIPLTGAFGPLSTAASCGQSSSCRSVATQVLSLLPFPRKKKDMTSLPARERIRWRQPSSCCAASRARRCADAGRCQHFLASPHRTVKLAHQPPARTHRTMRSKYAPRRSSSSQRCSVQRAARLRRRAARDFSVRRCRCAGAFSHKSWGRGRGAALSTQCTVSRLVSSPACSRDGTSTPIGVGSGLGSKSPRLRRSTRLSCAHNCCKASASRNPSFARP